MKQSSHGASANSKKKHLMLCQAIHVLALWRTRPRESHWAASISGQKKKRFNGADNTRLVTTPQQMKQMYQQDVPCEIDEQK